MNKKEQILSILNLLVLINGYSTDEAAEDILNLFNITNEEIEKKSVEYSTNNETKEFYESCCWDFQNGAKWIIRKIKGEENE